MIPWTLDERDGALRIALSATSVGWEDIETVLLSLRGYSRREDVRYVLVDLVGVDALGIGAVGTLAAWKWLAEARGQRFELIARAEVAEQLRRCGLEPASGSEVPTPRLFDEFALRPVDLSPTRA